MERNANPLVGPYVRSKDAANMATIILLIYIIWDYIINDWAGIAQSV